jgi:DNA helicase-2/ATP-dependent DNA helicase PcrA
MNKMILFKNEMEKMTLEQKLLFLISKAIHPNQINPSEYQKALDDLIEKAKNQSGRITDFLNGLSLQTDADMVNMKSEKVTLMTMHASKGTEFSVVFISGCEDGLIPYQKPGADNMDTEEERRLFYVAMTRAKEKLYCTWSLKRKLYGKMRLNRISPFLDQIDTSIVNQCVFRKPEKKNIKQNQIALF